MYSSILSNFQIKSSPSNFIPRLTIGTVGSSHNRVRNLLLFLEPMQLGVPKSKGILPERVVVFLKKFIPHGSISGSDVYNFDSNSPAAYGGWGRCICVGYGQ